MRKTMKRPFAMFLLWMSLISVSGAAQAPAQIDKALNNPPSITVDGKTISFSDVFAKRLQRIRNSGVIVFYPAYVPVRFKLASFSVARCEDSNAYLDYSLKFCDRSNLCFSVESACSGIGSAAGGDRSLTVRSRRVCGFLPPPVK